MAERFFMHAAFGTFAANYRSMEKWAEKLTLEIDQKLEKSRVQDLRFFRIDEFKRNVERVEKFSSSCADCKRFKTEISESVQNINEAIKTPGRERRGYDRLINRLSKHIRKEHGFYPPFYFSYVYALFGIIGGALLGYLLVLVKPELRIEMFSIGISVGLIISYILGSTKDKKIRLQKKLM